MDSAFWGQILNFKVNSHAGLDADFADKVNYLFTSSLMIIMTLVLSLRYFCGKVITCWSPTEFTAAQIEFTENYCWVMSTWKYNFTAYTVPQNVNERDSLKVNYYQWLPFLLVLCSLMFHLPLMIYRMMNWNSGIKVFQIMKLASDVDMTQDKDDRDGSISFIARYLHKTLLAQHHIPRGCFGKCKMSASNYCLWVGKHYGNYLTTLYFIIKALYLTNAIAQFFIMFRFLGTEHAAFYGIEYLMHASTGHQFDEVDTFPRETWCDITLKRLYNDHRYTVQCLLPINLFAEKIFVFLWFWYVFVTVCTIWSILLWLWRMVFRTKRIKFVKNYLALTGTIKGKNYSKYELAEFVEKELRYDGVFLMNFIAMNCGELACAEILSKMWKMYSTSKPQRNSTIEPNLLRDGDSTGRKQKRDPSTNSSSPVNNEEPIDV